MVLIVLRLAAEGRGVGRAVWVFVSLHDPQTAAMIPGHGDGILHHRFMREAADLVALRHGHFLPRFLGRGAFVRRWQVGAGEFFGLREEVRGQETEREEKERAHGVEGYGQGSSRWSRRSRRVRNGWKHDP